MNHNFKKIVVIGKNEYQIEKIPVYATHKSIYINILNKIDNVANEAIINVLLGDNLVKLNYNNKWFEMAKTHFHLMNERELKKLFVEIYLFLYGD